MLALRPFVTPDLLLDSFFNRDMFPGFRLDKTKGEYAMTVDIPGVPKENINIVIHDNMLTIEGKRSTSNEYGHYKTSVRLPPDADHDTLSATLEYGVLRLTVSKRPDAQSADTKRVYVR